MATRLQQYYKPTNDGWEARVTTTHDALAGEDSWLALALLSLIVALILLIACANLANVMLARATDRRREVALRTALGASRGTIVRQLLVESVLLGVVGGGVGLALAAGGVSLLKAIAYEEIFAMLEIDRNVLAFATIITFTASIAFSLVPALQASRADIAELLKGGSARTAGDGRSRRGRALLVVSQISLAMALAVVAVLTVRSLVETNRIDVGYDTHELFGFLIDVPPTRYTEAQLPALYDRVSGELRGLPGVERVGLADHVPVIGGDATGPLTIEGRFVRGPQDQPWGATTFVNPDFYAATRIRVLAGRAFTDADRESAAPVAIVSRELARRYWGAPNAALGKRIASGTGESPRWATIVGVSSDTRPAKFTLPPGSQVYFPMAQRPSRGVAFLLRSARATTLASDVRQAVRRVDPGLAIYDARPVDETFAIDMSTSVVLTGMYGVFAAIALALAAAGLYGVIAYSVSQRTREIGIRMALGATAGEVRRLVLAQAGRLLLVGTVIGIAGGAVIASGARSLLYGVSVADPTTYALVLAILVTVMAVATVVPARRATGVDPNEALRAD
jgi:predicted permease